MNAHQKFTDLKYVQALLPYTHNAIMVWLLLASDWSGEHSSIDTVSKIMKLGDYDAVTNWNFPIHCLSLDFHRIHSFYSVAKTASFFGKSVCTLHEFLCCNILGTKTRRNVVYYPCCPEPYPDVRFTVYLRRRTLYYIMNVVVPCLLLSVLSMLGKKS